MKSTGIVRRIDDLGRVVIPKEIRRRFGIREGDPLEIFIDDDGSVAFKKYSEILSFRSLADYLCRAARTASCSIMIVTSRDQVIATAQTNQKLLNVRIGEELRRIIDSRNVFESDGETVFVDTEKTTSVSLVIPIIVEGEVVGSVAVLGPRSASPDAEYTSAKMIAEFLSKNMGA